jgi:GTP-binding protein EngB required for normal cell division
MELMEMLKTSFRKFDDQFADISENGRKRLQELIDWYLFSGEYEQAKIVFIIDADVGFTEMDLEMLHALEEYHKSFVIVANKIDKIKPSEFDKKIEIIKELSGSHRVILYSATTGVGIGELAREITGRGATKKTQIFGGPRVVRGVKSRPRASRTARHEE